MTELDPIDLQAALEGVTYPATKQDLIAHAITQVADDSVLEALERLSEGVYDGIDQVLSAAYTDRRWDQ